MERNHIQNLIQEYLTTSNKVKKFDRVIFKRLAPNVAEVSEEFHSLAIKFEECGLYQYSGMCFLGAAKCQKSLANDVCEIDYYLKSARAFVKANEEEKSLELKSNQNEYLEGAMKSYNNALAKLSENSVMKAAIIREMKTLFPTYEDISNFSSPCHRFHDLETSASECIKNYNYLLALEKLTDIFDNINERKKEHLYEELLSRIEVSRLLLLIILNLPPARQSPSHIKILEKFVSINTLDQQTYLNIPDKIYKIMKNLVLSWSENNMECMLVALNELSNCIWITLDHRMLIDYLIEKCSF
ncbi:uncharacterized protein LOC129612774 [Condylostylus longicornis]|uniref:uncharacterized protein LOC129612774 n=1 Tax=Condylostylus longicornis TaxID=2530218 RepID=UPI00244DF493|nr:uncharacterized protein LOC129612774 [Condylostylus longicornis]